MLPVASMQHAVFLLLSHNLCAGDASLYGPDRQRYFKLPASLPPPLAKHPSWDGPFAVHTTEAPPTAAGTWLPMRSALIDSDSAIGLVGLDVHYPR
jgi:hypothetical protein